MTRHHLGHCGLIPNADWLPIPGPHKGAVKPAVFPSSILHPATQVSHASQYLDLQMALASVCLTLALLQFQGPLQCGGLHVHPS